MKIYQIDYYMTDPDMFNQDIMRSKMMSMFSNNKIIDAIATASIFSTMGCIEFKFEQPIVIED